MSLVTYASVFQRSPKGAWHPEVVTPDQARTLQDLAWGFVSRYYENYQPLTLEQCRARLLSDEGLAPLWNYIRQAYWRKDIGVAHSYVRYLRRLFASQRLFAAESAQNPFYFDPETDKSYWLAPP
jgi:hypothetical protein